jgi:hypothetical protein
MDASTSRNASLSFEGSLSSHSGESFPPGSKLSKERDHEVGQEKSSRTLTAQPEFSEGGLRGWLTIIGG